MVMRIGTTAAYTLYRSQMTNIQSRIADKSYQSVTGERYNSYDRYGLSTYRMVTLENEQKIVDQYLENNEITAITLESMEAAVDSIRTILLDFQSSLTTYYSNDLSHMDTQEGITETATLQESAFEAMSQLAYFLNTQVDGVYVFGGGNNTTQPVKFDFKSLEEFQSHYDGNFLTYPTTTQAVLNQTIVTDNITGGLTFQQNEVKADTNLTSSLIFNGIKNEDGTVTGHLSASAGTFSGLVPGDTLTVANTTDNNDTFTIASVSADGSTVTFENTDVIADEIISKENVLANGVSLTTGGGVGLNVDTATSASYCFESIVVDDEGTPGGVLTGAIGAFSDFQSGDEITITGMGANDGVYLVKDVSLDGRKITFADGTVVTPAVWNKDSVGFDDISITQRAVTGTISAINPDGYVVSSHIVNDGTRVTIAPDGVTLTTTVPDDFKNIESGSSVRINGQTVYVKNIVVDEGTNTAQMTLSSDTKLTPGTLPPGSVTIETLSDEHGFVSSVLKGGEQLTGDISFNVAKNEITAGVTGAFSNFSSGDTIVLKGADGNNGVYYIDSVGSDGRSIQLSSETPLLTDMTVDTGTGVSFGLTYPVSSILGIDNVNPSYDGSYSVLGVSNDGNTLTVKTEKFKTTAESFVATDFQKVATQSYYQGSALENNIRIGENTTIKLDIDASENAFAKIFTALGQLAQGNLIDMRDPEKTLDAVDPERVEKRVTSAMSLIADALSSYRSGDPYGNITNIQYSIVSKKTRLDNMTISQTNLSESLTTYIGNIKNVDKTQAVTELLQEQTNLQAAYQVFSTLNSMTLLDYI